jgi:hypothetical protein
MGSDFRSMGDNGSKCAVSAADVADVAYVLLMPLLLLLLPLFMTVVAATHIRHAGAAGILIAWLLQLMPPASLLFTTTCTPIKIQQPSLFARTRPFSTLKQHLRSLFQSPTTSFST